MAVLTVTANNESSLRSTIAGAADGDTVNVPAGTYTLTAPIILTNTGIQVFGEGKLTNISCLNGTLGANNAFQITNPAPAAGIMSRLRISNLKITGDGGAALLAGISFVSTLNKAFLDWEIDRVTVSGMQDGINLDNSPSNAGGGLGEHCVIRQCSITTNRRWGIAVISMPQTLLELVDCNASGVTGIRLITSNNSSIKNSASEGNNTTNNASLLNGAQTYIATSHGFIVDNLYSELLPTAAGAAKIGLTVANCLGGIVRGFEVQQTAFQSDSIALHLAAPPCKGITVDVMRYSFITSPILVDSGCEGPFIRNAGIIRVAP